MSGSDEIIPKSADLHEIFGNRPLSRFLNLNLTADQIHNEALRFDSSGKIVEESEEKNLKKLEQMKFLATNCLNQCVDEVKKILGNSAENEETQQVFLIYLDNLVQNSVLTLNETQSEKLKKEMNLNEALEATKRFDLKFDLLHNEWQKQQRKVEQILDEKESKIQNLKSDMELLKFVNDEKIRKAVDDGNQKLAKNTRMKLNKAQKLPEILKSVEFKNEKSKRESLLEVHKLKEQKIKVEQVLQAMLTKFDQDIGGKAEELRKLKKSVDDQRNSFDIWKTVAEDQKALYEKLMKEKEEEMEIEISSQRKSSQKQPSVQIKKSVLRNKMKKK